jgi:general secretion pathway protein I
MWNGQPPEAEGLRMRRVISTPCRYRWRRGLGQPSTAGFTLLEVMVALAIIAIALVPLMRLHLLSLDATMRAQGLTTAVLLAQEQMALLPLFPEAGEEQGRFDDPTLAAFRWHTAVTEEEIILGASAQLMKLRHIVVTIVWVEGQREHYYTLEKYVAQ